MEETKKGSWLMIGIVVILVIGGFWYFRANNQQKTVTNESIKIGWIGGLSGDSAIVGTANLNGVKLAVDNINKNGGINGKQIELIVNDDKYDAKETLSAYTKLITLDGVKYFLIENYNGFLATSPLVMQDNTIIINPIDTSEELAGINANSFAVGVYDESIGYAMADYLNNNNVSKIGILTNNGDPFPLMVRDSLMKRFKGTAQDEYYNFDTTDFRTSLNKLSGNKHLVLIGWEETGRIVKQARESKINSEIIGIDTFATENFRKNSNNNYEGLKFSFWKDFGDNSLYEKMILDYKTKYGKESDNVLFTAVGYDAMSVLADGLNKCGNEDTDCFKNKMLDLKDFKGVSGNITMDKDNITRSIRETMFMYKNGEIEKVQ